MGGHGEVGVGGENAEVVEVVGGATVVSIAVLELAKVVESIDLLKGDLDEAEDMSDGRACRRTL